MMQKKEDGVTLVLRDTSRKIMTKIKRSISFDADVLKILDEYCSQYKIDRSALVNKAVQSYVLSKPRGDQDEVYRAMVESVAIKALHSPEVEQAVKKVIQSNFFKKGGITNNE
jgi:metal-responsive CopG/Arc/MetJ family transcriptional regulator